MTDFRALCAELVENLERYQCWYIEDNGYGIDTLEALLRRANAALAQPEPQGPDLTACDLLERFIDCFWDEQDAESYPNAAALVAQARALLAQPEPQGLEPTDDELQKIADALRDEDDTLSLVEYARTVLARWGRPAVEPVPVSERLPGLEDCDVEGRCWCFSPGAQIEGILIFNPRWYFGRIANHDVHWLPHWALPVPNSN